MGLIKEIKLYWQAFRYLRTQKYLDKKCGGDNSRILCASKALGIYARCVLKLWGDRVDTTSLCITDSPTITGDGTPTFLKVDGRYIIYIPKRCPDFLAALHHEMTHLWQSQQDRLPDGWDIAKSSKKHESYSSYWNTPVERHARLAVEAMGGSPIAGPPEWLFDLEKIDRIFKETPLPECPSSSTMVS